MKSKRSCFEPGIFRNLLQRFWPLWAGYLLVMLFILPMSLGTTDFSDWDMISSCGADGQILRCVHNCVFIAFLSAGISATAVFSHLYQSRSCGMMASLPAKRESVFLSAYLAGLLPLLAANVISAGFTMLLALGNPLIHAAVVLRWLWLTCLIVFSFYSFAALCAMLTGNILVLFPVYAVLELTAYAIQGALEYLLQILSYGYAVQSTTPTVLSPLAKLYDALQVTSEYSWVTAANGSVWNIETAVRLEGTGYIFAYAAVGILLTAAAMLLYRRRSMEAAGDTVAIPALKPIFRYCMSFGCALTAPLTIYLNFLDGRIGGSESAVFIICTGVVCAVIGWYAAQMIVQRSFRVFSAKPMGLILTCGLFLFISLGIELDICGLERRVPQLQDIESVSLGGSYARHGKAVLQEQQNLEAVLALNRDLIEAKPGEDSPGGYVISLDYIMKDGSKLGRVYTVQDTALLQEQIDLLNAPEAIRAYFPDDPWIGADTLSECLVSYRITDPDSGMQNWNSIRLAPAQAWLLYSEGILADAAEGNICRVSLDDNAQSEDAWIEIETLFRQGDSYESCHWSYAILQRCSENSLKWLAENTDLDLEAILGYNGSIANG